MANEKIKSKKEKTYWPHMILGFLILGMTLSYWTVKSASSLPVQESNEYMLKYQKADMNINEILEKKMLFDKSYDIEIVDAKTMVMTDNIHSKVAQVNPVKLTLGKNTFSYIVTSKTGDIVSDANVTFMLTRPHTVRDDMKINSIPFKNNKYSVSDVNISNEGRYTLLLRVQIKDSTGYSQIPAYLKL